MKFYHGTSEEAWNQIQNDGILFGYQRIISSKTGEVLEEYRTTYLAEKKEDAAKYGDVLLEVEYDPNDTDNNYWEPGCWQLRVYKPIPLGNIKRIL